MRWLTRQKVAAGFRGPPPAEDPADPAADPAADVAIPTAAAAPPPPPQSDVLHHCPFCGSGNVTGNSDGSASCGFCSTNFKVYLQPSHPFMPQTIDGQPFETEDSPRLSDDPVGTAGGVTPGAPPPGAPAVPGAPAAPAGGGLERFRVQPSPTLPPGLSHLVTQAGYVLPVNSYMAHLAIAHAEDRDLVVEQVRASRD